MAVSPRKRQRGDDTSEVWRAEAPAWDGKHLTFTLGHFRGAAVNGSFESRAPQRVECRSRVLDGDDRLSLAPTAFRERSRVDVRPIADELAKARPPGRWMRGRRRAKK